MSTPISKKAHRANNAATGIIYGLTGATLLLLAAIFLYVFYKAFHGFEWKLLSFTPEGIGNQFFNTVYMVFLALLFSVPLGVGAGIYMAEYAGVNKLTKAIRIAIETLSSLPSIVVGLFGYLVFILYVGASWNMISGALALAIINLPLLTTVTEDAFRALPDHYRSGSLALGATRWQTITRVLLPTAASRMITGVVLAAGRCCGEAAALLYTAGMSTDLNWSNWDLSSPTCPLNPIRPSETLALKIWSSRTESLATNAASLADVSSAALLLLVLIFGFLARYLAHRLDRLKDI